MENRLRELEDKVYILFKKVNWLRFGNILYLPVIFLFIFGSIFIFSNSFRRSHDVGQTIHYYGTTIVGRPVKQYHMDVNPTTGNNGSYSISSLGLTTILDIQATLLRNTTNASDVPAIALKSYSTSAINYNIVQANPATVSILGSNVLSGSPQAFPSTPNDITIKFVITGY